MFPLRLTVQPRNPVHPIKRARMGSVKRLGEVVVERVVPPVRVVLEVLVVPVALLVVEEQGVRGDLRVVVEREVLPVQEEPVVPRKLPV